MSRLWTSLPCPTSCRIGKGAIPFHSSARFSAASRKALACFPPRPMFTLRSTFISMLGLCGLPSSGGKAILEFCGTPTSGGDFLPPASGPVGLMRKGPKVTAQKGQNTPPPLRSSILGHLSAYRFDTCPLGTIKPTGPSAGGKKGQSLSIPQRASARLLDSLQRGFSKGFSMLSTSAHVYSEIYLHLNLGALWAAVLGREGNPGILRHAAFRRRFLAPGFSRWEKGAIPFHSSARFSAASRLASARLLERL